MASGARLRDLGLSVPVTEVLDAALWRSRYAHAIALGPEVQTQLTTQLCRVEGMNELDTAALLDELNGQLSAAINEIPEEVIRWHLRVSLSELEVKLGIPMGIVIVKSNPVDEGLVQGVHYDRMEPRRPYTHSDARTWYRIDIPSSVISVERVRGFYFDQLVWEFSPGTDTINQVHLEWAAQGGLHIIPVNFQNIVVSQPGGGGTYGVWHTLALQRSPVPDFWAVDYTLGPRDRQSGQCGHVPAVLAHWVGANAAITLLSIGGAAKSQGLTSSSLSFDGFSKSVGLQASAIYGLNSALEEVYRQATKRIDWNQIKRALKGIRVRPYGY